MKTLLCKLFGHKTPYTQKLFCKICPRCQIVIVTILLALMTFTGCCPKPLPPLPPKVITVLEPCMLPVPSLPYAQWPYDVSEDGTFHVPEQDGRAISLMLETIASYLAEQEIRCKLKPNASPTPSLRVYVFPARPLP